MLGVGWGEMYGFSIEIPAQKGADLHTPSQTLLIPGRENGPTCLRPVGQGVAEAFDPGRHPQEIIREQVITADANTFAKASFRTERH